MASEPETDENVAFFAIRNGSETKMAIEDEGISSCVLVLRRLVSRIGATPFTLPFDIKSNPKSPSLTA